MDFRILGPLVVRDRGRLIELRRRKPRALLAFLLLRPGETCSSDTLIDALWGEQPPRTARAALQNYVAQLRRALGPGVVVSQGGGYLLDVSPEQIDLARFERLTGEGRAAQGEDRVEKLQEALALWRGSPLADLAFEPFAAHETPGLEELRTTALEDLIEARLALGGTPDLVPELEELIAEHPFRERLRGQLMLALYRSGRQADALEAYRETRLALVDELGIEPSAPLRELEQAILRQEAWLDPAPERQRETPPEERRKTVTILFADIDSPETIDPELLRKATVNSLVRVRAVLEGHGATIEQRAGDEVLAVFGIPQAHEDDAVRAVRAALDLIDGEGLDAEGVELRVGIETGEVLAGVDETGHGFAAGPAITLAKRMLQRAGPSEVLLGPAALRVLGAAVVAEPTPDGDALVLELAEDVSAPPRRLEAQFVDRGPELDALRRAFADAVDARSCRVFLLLGEAGIGKTRLASELASELDGAATFLTGRCVSYGKGATYLPLAEIVRQVGERQGLAELLAGDEHADLIAARLADLTGDDQAPGSGGETFWAARRLFESLASERPLVLAFEDLHWAEPTLLDLIDYFAERVSAAPILLLGLARPELLDERAEWRDNEAATLVPLSGEASEVLIENLGEAPGGLRKQILRAAGGNPLFIEQLLAHANEGGEPATVPPSLDALLASRLDLLEPGELSLLQRASVAGREFSREAVAHLLAPDKPAAAEEALFGVERKGLIREDAGRYRFHHVLIRDAAYATLPKTQRADLHERFGRWLEDRPRRSDELIGFHLEQAYRYRAELAPEDAESRQLAADGGERLAAAGLRAAKSGDTHAASNLLGRACLLLEEQEVVRRDLLTELGVVHWRAGDLQAVYGTLHQALEGALAVGDSRAELRARIELAYLKLFREPEGGADELLSVTVEAIPALEKIGDDRTLGVIWAMLAHVHGGFHCRYRESAEAAERAIEHYARAGWPPTACLQELAVSLYFGPVSVEDGIRRCSVLLEHSDRPGEGHVLVFLAGLEAMAGRFDAARSLAFRARATYEDLDWADKVWTNYAPIAADVELLAGEHAEAERLLAESCKHLESWGEQARLATQAAQLGEALYRQGKFEEAARWAAVAEGCAASDDASAQFSWRALRAKGLAREGAFGRAQVLAQEAVDIAAPTDAVTQRAHVLLDAAEVASLSGRVRAGVGPVEEAVRLLEEKGNVASLERARSTLAQVTSA